MTLLTKPRKGLVHVYTGNGKGKTTCALGLAFRALGWGFRVCFIQFIKGYPEIGELKLAPIFNERFILKQFAVDIGKYIGKSKVLERKESAQEAFAYAEKAIASGDYDLVVLDEINVAVHYGLISEESVLNLINSKPADLELILTGRNATSAVIEAADYVTEMQCLKHPYEQGIKARKGIDY